jgi:single stranded DNA-binding protein
MNLNNITIIGRVGRDPEWKEVGGGLCKFSVAVSRNTKKGAEWVSETDWFDVSVWGDYGKRLMEKIAKGNLVYVTGPFESRKHDEKTYWTLTGRSVIKLEKNEPKPQQAKEENPLDGGDDLPW